jgi:hypothetical protein
VLVPVKVGMSGEYSYDVYAVSAFLTCLSEHKSVIKGMRNFSSLSVILNFGVDGLSEQVGLEATSLGLSHDGLVNSAKTAKSQHQLSRRTCYTAAGLPVQYSGH